MNISFDSKAALVTGAASGLGLATAKAFAEAGACRGISENSRDFPLRKVTAGHN